MRDTSSQPAQTTLSMVPNKVMTLGWRTHTQRMQTKQIFLFVFHMCHDLEVAAQVHVEIAMTVAKQIRLCLLKVLLNYSQT